MGKPRAVLVTSVLSLVNNQRARYDATSTPDDLAGRYF
jgi:hypothetical protein